MNIYSLDNRDKSFTPKRRSKVDDERLHLETPKNQKGTKQTFKGCKCEPYEKCKCF